VLILDEPTTGLDPNQIIEIRELIMRIGQKKTVLLSTHIMQEVQAMCSRVIIISNGRIAADAPIGDLQQNARQGALRVSFEDAIDPLLFRKIKGIRKQEQVQPNIWRLYTDTPDALRREVMQWALQNNLNISALQQETQSLEEVFRVLTR
jgi:ABC-2 type transport system ATP-binding protein